MTLAEKPQVVFLLTVWGKSYVRNFLEISLPTLLAPGNIPAMAEAYRCRFILLTSANDTKFFENHPACIRLKQYCDITTMDISDLIFDGNHSTTLTMALTRAIKSMGDAITSSYFVTLVSDYIMADGSFRNMLRYMQEGYDVITAGNYQIIEEETLDLFKRNLNRQTWVAAYTPRQLVKLSFEHIHPITFANTVNQSFCHNNLSNRLFWRVDENTMIGRFYLRHIICIKPQRSDFKIGASCDYSFWPEMCPTGKVKALTDSDEYFVLEMQNLHHELQYVRPNPFNIQELANHLSEWTTAEHRLNAYSANIFHAADIPPQTHKAIAQSEAYIKQLAEKLSVQPQPSRGHPYWVGAIQCAMDYIKSKTDISDMSMFQDFIHGRPRRQHQWLKRLYSFIFGQVPYVSLFHREYHDYQPFMHFLQKIEKASPEATRVPVVSIGRGNALYHFHAGKKVRYFVQDAHHFLARNTAAITSAVNTAPYIVIVFERQSDSEKLFEVMRLLGNTIHKPIKVLLYVSQPARLNDNYFVSNIFARIYARFIQHEEFSHHVSYVTSNVRKYINPIIGDIHVSLQESPSIPRILRTIVPLTLTHIVIFLTNLGSMAFKADPKQSASSGFMYFTLQPHREQQQDLSLTA